MASSSSRRSGSSGTSGSRKRVVIGADETTRVRYNKDRPQVESERRKTQRQSQRAAAQRAGVNGGPRPTGSGKRIAQEKRDERDRRRRSIARRRAATVILGLALLVGLVWGASALWKAPIFSIDQVVVEGNHHVSTKYILASADVPSDATLFRVPIGDIETRVKSDPWIAEANASRHFPHTLQIDVVERVPAALVDAGGGQLWLLSADGYWLGKKTADDTATLVPIRDLTGIVPTAGVAAATPEAMNALAVLRGLSPQLASQVKAVSAPTVDKTALVLNDGVQVFIGDATDISKKDLITRGILAREKNIVYINVRVVDRPTWRGLEQGN